MDTGLLKRDNRGFSLVELIVVILIIAILAVALAPQIIRYVTQARSNSDESNKAVLTSAVQAAVTEFVGKGGDIDKNLVYKAEPGTTSATLVRVGDSETNESNISRVDVEGVQISLFELIKQTTTEFPKISDTAGAYWYITILKDGESVSVDILTSDPASLSGSG